MKGTAFESGMGIRDVPQNSIQDIDDSLTRKLGVDMLSHHVRSTMPQASKQTGVRMLLLHTTLNLPLVKTVTADCFTTLGMASQHRRSRWCRGMDLCESKT